jgi:SAM-dependent methyltransferase
MACSGRDAPSPSIVRWSNLVPTGGTVLDVAAGGGRHATLFAELGHTVLALDRDTTALLLVPHPRITVLRADLEGAPWPLAGRTFAAVVVTNYLWRPLLPTLVASVAPGGVLMYETFAAGQERLGRPRNPDFLLQPGELLEAVRNVLEVREYVHGEEGEPPTAVRQRLCALRARSPLQLPAAGSGASTCL